MISAIFDILGKAFSFIIDRKVTKSSFLRGIRILSSAIVLVLWAFKCVPIKLEYSSSNLLSFVHFIDSTSWFTISRVYWILVIGFLVIASTNDLSHALAKVANRDKKNEDDFVQKWAIAHTFFEVIEIAYSLYYSFYVCYLISGFLCGLSCTLPLWFSSIHFGLYVTITLYNDNYKRCKKSYEWKHISPYCDVNGKTICSEMKVYYNGKAYYAVELSESLVDITKDWYLISTDRKSKLKLAETDYHQLVIAQS